MSSPALRSRFGYPDLSGTAILVVEDHPDSLTFLAEILRFCGAEALTSPSAKHARTHLRLNIPSLVLCDFFMPQETGLEFIAWLRRHEDRRLRTVPAVAVTAYPGDFLRHSEAHAFDAYFVKPVEVPRLLHTIATLLKRPTAAESPRSG